MIFCRRKNEDEALRRRQQDDKFYQHPEPSPEPQEVLDTIMENVNERMKNFNKKPSKSSSSDKMKIFQQQPLPGGHPQRSGGQSQLSGGQGEQEQEGAPRVVSQEMNMDSVVSDLNSFLASTRLAISSPGKFLNYYIHIFYIR